MFTWCHNPEQQHHHLHHHDNRKSQEHEMLCNLYNLIISEFSIAAPVPDYVKAVVDTITVIHEHEPSGDVLAFLTGQEEVDRAVSLLKEQVIDNKDNCKLHFRITGIDTIHVYMHIYS
jgi:HrpA-like RNA helicase